MPEREIERVHKETVFVVVSPAREAHPALDRAIINAKVRQEGEESRLIVYVTIDPEVQDTRADNPKVYCKGGWFEGIIDRLKEADIEHEIVVSWSQEWGASILREIKEYQADLVMGSLYDDWDTKNSMFTNDYWKVLRSVDCPVLLCREGKPAKRRVILAAVKEQDDNYFDLCTRVHDRARWAADRYGAEFHLVNAYEDSMNFPDRSRMLRISSGLANENLHIKQGNPVDVICEVADEINADTIVIGTKRRSGLKAVFKGNTIEKLITRAKQDIMMQVE
jgi:universal stress protein E